jgi:ankyrin repeat protein
MKIKLFEEFSEDWDSDEFLFDLYAMSKDEANDLFMKEIRSNTPNLEKIEVMIKSGLVDLKAKDEDGWTPLHVASRRNRIEIAKLLIDRGADVEAKVDGWTPLHLASRWNCIETAKLLLERGADVEAKDDCGQTPLHLAQSDEMAELLKKYMK